MRLIITGQMRSGTTFLTLLLNAQPEVLLYPDVLHIARLKEAAGVQSLTDSLSASQRNVVVDRFFGGGDGCQAIFTHTGTELNFWVEPSSFDTLLQFYILILAQVAIAGHRIVGHKTTAAEGALGELLELVPDLHCLYLVRDPRDVLLSALQRRRQNRALVLQRWRDGVRSTLRVRQMTELRNRVLIIRYEDLMAKPQDAMSQVCDFLGMGGFSFPAQLDWYGQPFVANTSFGDVQRLFETRGIGRWKSEASHLAALAEMIAGSELVQTGYEQHRYGLGPRLYARLLSFSRFEPNLRRLVSPLASLVRGHLSEGAN